MTHKKVVIDAEFITPLSRDVTQRRVSVLFNNGDHETLFDFSEDEVAIEPEDFLGLTKDECLELFAEAAVRRSKELTSSYPQAS